MYFNQKKLRIYVIYSDINDVFLRGAVYGGVDLFPYLGNKKPSFSTELNKNFSATVIYRGLPNEQAMLNESECDSKRDDQI